MPLPLFVSRSCPALPSAPQIQPIMNSSIYTASEICNYDVVIDYIRRELYYLSCLLKCSNLYLRDHSTRVFHNTLVGPRKYAIR